MPGWTVIGPVPAGCPGPKAFQDTLRHPTEIFKVSVADDLDNEGFLLGESWPWRPTRTPPELQLIR